MEVTIRHGVVYLKGDVDLVKGAEVLSEVVGDSRLFVRKTNIEGIFTYGCEQLADEYMGHRAGYIWSSRAACMNAVFDCALVECNYTTSGYSYTSCAIDCAHLEPLLEDTEYEIDWTPVKRDEDVVYNIRKKATT